MKEFAIFDIDNTILEGQSQQALLKYLYNHGYLKFWQYIKLNLWFLLYKIKIIKNPRPALEYALQCLKGKSEDEMEHLMDIFFVETLVWKIFPKALEEISEHASAGRTVILLSNAVEPIVKRVAKHVGAHFHIGTKLEVKGGAYTGKIEGDIVYGENKAIALNMFMYSYGQGLKKTWGYGDNASDVYFLSTMTYPHVVDADKKLRKIAKNHGWKIKSFKSK